MLRTMQACVRRQLWRSARFTVRVPVLTRQLWGSARFTARVPVLTRQLCSEDRRRVQSCVVHSNLEEQFVFLDCAGTVPSITRVLLATVWLNDGFCVILT